MSSIPILGQQSQEKPVMPSDPVPDHFIVHASTPTLTIYAESFGYTWTDDKIFGGVCTTSRRQKVLSCAESNVVLHPRELARRYSSGLVERT